MDTIGAPTHVLVVDDDSAVSSLFERILSAEGYRVHTAADVDSAQEAIEQQPPDVILLDVVLPGTGTIVTVAARCRRRQPIAFCYPPAMRRCRLVTNQLG